MNKKISRPVTIAMLALSVSFCGALTLVSCKKDAATLVDDNSASVPPASPDAVLTPEPNIGSPEIAAPTPPPPPADGKYPMMTFTNTDHDFGVINAGDKVTYSFNFENTGKADLIITSATGSCGCTVPEYPKEPIAPGKSGKIKVSFNSAGKHGEQHKSVTLTTNTVSGKEMLNIKASIKDAANQ